MSHGSEGYKSKIRHRQGWFPPAGLQVAAFSLCLHAALSLYVRVSSTCHFVMGARGVTWAQRDGNGFQRGRWKIYL